MAGTEGRTAQKTRTREAILAGARDLMARGLPVTVTEAAACSGISKATAYRYFSDPAVLAAEAGLALEVRAYEDIVAGCTTPRQRLRAISLYFFDLALEREPAFRQFLARYLDAWAAGAETLDVRRGARRVTMFRRALEGSGLPKDRADALVRALSAATGTEAMIALLDVVQTDRDTARRTVADMAEALMDRHLGAGTG